MRRMTIAVEPDMAARVIDLAIAAGAASVTRNSAQRIDADGTERAQAVLDLYLPAPGAGDLTRSLSHLPPGSWSMASGRPRAIHDGFPLARETRPYPVAGMEIEEDLWEFCQITISMILRVVLASALVAYGMITGNLPVMLAGLLFLPYHHVLLALALGLVRRRWHLVAHGAVVFFLTTLTIAGAGAAVAWVKGGELGWQAVSGAGGAVFIGLVVGAAAALASADDAGRHELIGLAATAHLSVLPVWGGIMAVLGHAEGPEITARALDFVLSVLSLIAAAGVVFLFAGASHGVPDEGR
jgi:hypothetical protein